MKFSPRWIAMTLLLSLLLATAACTKKEESAAKVALLGGIELADKLPPETYGFVLVDLDNPAYSKFRQTQWGGKEWEIQKLLSAAEDDPDMQQVSNALQESGIIEELKSGRALIKEAALFVTSGANSELGGGLYLAAEEDIDFAPMLKVLRESLLKAEFTVADAEFSGISGIKADREKNGTNLQITAAFNRNLFALTSEAGYTARLFNPTAQGGLKELTESANYQRLEPAIQRPGIISIAYIDTMRAAKTLQPLIDKYQQAAPVKTALKLEEFPLVALAGVGGMHDTPFKRAAMIVSPKTPLQEGLFASLRKTAPSKALEQAPANATAVISIDADVLAFIKNNTLENMPPAQRGAFQEQLKVLDHISTLAIQLGAGGGGTPLPDLALLMGSTDPSRLKQSLRQQLEPMMQMFPAGWQTKKVADQPVEYAVSMIGVGLFLAETDKMLLVGSSESALRGVLEAGQGQTGSAAKKIPAAALKGIKQEPPFLTVYLNFVEAAKLAQTVAGSMAMFTGGQAAVEPQTIADLQSMGRQLWRASLQKDLALVDVHFFE